ncbi:PaaI family thioesterase [Desulfuromonas acetoxidans]|uniref:Phenylacetic acid degradation-related protein n=1 Tax=Desulfuromonas acetoxidans (strain DSM 684 / 11070) TaxID=281689 RepID=Q1JYL8_DESA6|nr:PaaI family thioesterase [Desulfuromonas acetoxidans]EAT15397.1 Phenylacetic acid degradation-related protein [Desulfuromonas acetoxidans DSM 684]MBF0646192.1 PaaI family thioesterase [Desulfuromonas acetoxidans]NVD24429.1 PaaI family thioesterase [Desulfuromonas acetoxidans]NVE16623.1 PaaI family thioesterase [Desulfuromonas acetoxidans]
MLHEESLGPHEIHLERWIECAPFEQLLGMDIVRAEDGEAILTMPFRRQYANGGSIMHGGATVSLADTAAVMALKSKVEPGTHFGTTDMAIRFLHPVIQGMITAKARVEQQEERLWHARVEIVTEADVVAMEMTAVFKISRRRLTTVAEGR